MYKSASPLISQAGLEEENKRLKDENARLAADNDALRCRVKELEHYAEAHPNGKEEADSWRGMDMAVWRQIEDARAGLHMALRQLEGLSVEGLSVIRPTERHTPAPASPPKQRVETETRCARPALAGTSCKTMQMSARQAEGPGATGHSATAIHPTVTSTLASAIAKTPAVDGVIDVDLPSFHLGYPQSNEREECCLGLISCEPSAIG